MYFDGYANPFKVGLIFDPGVNSMRQAPGPGIQAARENGADMFRWVLKEKLAGGPRPRSSKQPLAQVSKSIVDRWIEKTKSQHRIQSVICLLDEQQLRLYAVLPMDLISYYRENGLRVEHIPVRNYKHPALSDHELEKVWKAYKRLEKPVLVHCSAGIGRTGKAVSYIKRKLKNGTPQ
jgi:protein-tyrosine phosphatase